MPNMELVKSLGAGTAIDYKREDVGQVLTDYDLVLNSQDARTLETSLRQQRQRDRADSPVSAVRNL
jgi:NADPH:quinone reductase-like Zn-dependent oxidoreductase